MGHFELRENFGKRELWNSINLPKYYRDRRTHPEKLGTDVKENRKKFTRKKAPRKRKVAKKSSYRRNF